MYKLGMKAIVANQLGNEVVYTVISFDKDMQLVFGFSYKNLKTAMRFNRDVDIIIELDVIPNLEFTQNKMYVVGVFKEKIMAEVRLAIDLVERDTPEKVFDFHCPKCRISLKELGQEYCQECGQRLKWS